MQHATAEPVREEVLTVDQAAAEIGVSPAVVYAGVKAGMIPRVPLPGRLIRIPRSKWEQYKRGELDERGEPRLRPTAQQKEVIRGSKPIIQRR